MPKCICCSNKYNIKDYGFKYTFVHPNTITKIFKNDFIKKICFECAKSDDVTIGKTNAKKRFLLTDVELSDKTILQIIIRHKTTTNRRYIISQLEKYSAGKAKKDPIYKQKIEILRDKTKKKLELKRILEKKKNDLCDELTRSNVKNLNHELVKKK